jgi:DNA repair protein RadC
VFAVLFLNRANKINHFEIVSEGGITGTVADPRIILRKALEHDAVNIILCHNHPSGSLKPSRADEQLTVKIKEAARFFDIVVVDHIIVSEVGYFSFADEGIL